MALSADGKVIIIGDPGDVASPSFNDTSYVAVYAWNGTSWTPRKVSKKGFAAKDNFGCSVAISADGGVINIGAASAASSFYSNTLLYWNAATSSYEPTTTYMFTEAPGLQDRTPVTLAADGKTFAIGLIRYNKPWPSPLAQAGAIYVKKQGSNPTSWNGMSRFIYGTSTNDLLGYQICLSHDGSKLVAVSKSATDPAVYTYYLYDTGYVNTGAVIHADVYSASLSDDGMKLVTCNNTGVCTYYEWVNENWQVKNNSITLSRTPELGYRNISSINANGKRFATISGNTSNFSATSYTWCNGTYMGVEEPEERGVELASITVYPNPNNGAFTIKATNGQQINTVEVYNAMGQLVHTSVLEGNTTETNIELQNQPMGIYFVKVSANNTHETLRIMLKR